MSRLFYHRAANRERAGKVAKAPSPERGDSIDLRLFVCYAASELPAPPSACSPLLREAGRFILFFLARCRCVALLCAEPSQMTVPNAKTFAR